MPCLSDEVSYEWEQTHTRIVVTIDASLSQNLEEGDVLAAHKGADLFGRGIVELVSRSQGTLVSLQLYAPVRSARMPDGQDSISLTDSPTGPLVVLQLEKLCPEAWPSLLAHAVQDDERGASTPASQIRLLCRHELELPQNKSIEGVSVGDDAGVETVLEFHEAVMVQAVQQMGRGAWVPTLGDFPEQPPEHSAGGPQGHDEPEALLSRAMQAKSMEESRRLMGVAAVHYRYPAAVLHLCSSCSMTFPERYLWLRFGAVTLQSARCALQLADMYNVGDELPRYESLSLHFTQLAAMRGDTNAMRRLGPSWNYAAELRGDAGDQTQGAAPHRPALLPVPEDEDDVKAPADAYTLLCGSPAFTGATVLAVCAWVLCRRR